MGFSTNRCLPASAAAIACGGVQMAGTANVDDLNPLVPQHAIEVVPDRASEPQLGGELGGRFRPPPDHRDDLHLGILQPTGGVGPGDGPRPDDCHTKFSFVHGLAHPFRHLVGDWSIFRRKDVFWRTNRLAENMDLSPSRGARGTVPFSRRSSVFCMVTPTRAAKIGTVPCERLHPLVTALFAGRRSAFFPPCSRQLTSNCHGWRGTSILPENACFPGL